MRKEETVTSSEFELSETCDGELEIRELPFIIIISGSPILARIEIEHVEGRP